MGLARKSLFLMSGWVKSAAHVPLSAESRSSVDVAVVGEMHGTCTVHRDMYLRVYTAYTLFREHRDVHKPYKEAQ